MTDDIVERIRRRLNDAPMETERLLDEAADEIERLRLELKRKARISHDAENRI
jgi:hypothetical protein